MNYLEPDKALPPTLSINFYWKRLCDLERRRVFVFAIIQTYKMFLYKGFTTTRRGKTGGSGRVRVGSIGFTGQTGHGSKRVIFKQVNRVAGRVGSGWPVFFKLFFFNYKKTNIKLKRLRKKSNSHWECKRSRFIFNFQ